MCSFSTRTLKNMNLDLNIRTHAQIFQHFLALSCQPNTKTTNTNPNPNISKNTNTNPELAPPTTGTSRPPSHYLSLFTTTNNLQLNRSPITQKIQNTQKKNKPKNTSIIKSQSPKISKPNQKIQPSNNPIRLPLDQNEELCV